MKKIIFVLIVGIFLSTSIMGITAELKLIPDEAIRLRVLANSNSEYDQDMKNKVKDLVQLELYTLLKDSSSIDESREIIKNHVKEIDDKISTIFTEYNYDKDYNIDFGNHYFPSKEYKGILYDEGYYESLLITIGEGLGDNWWCVLFPPLCLIEAEESTNVEYKFFVQELINKYMK